MSGKCKWCDGGKPTPLGGKCRYCDGTGVDFSTCEGVPPGSGAEVLVVVGPCGGCNDDDGWDCRHRRPHKEDAACPMAWNDCEPCQPCGIRFPSHPGPDGRPIPDDPDAGRYWRRR